MLIPSPGPPLLLLRVPLLYLLAISRTARSTIWNIRSFLTLKIKWVFWNYLAFKSHCLLVGKTALLYWLCTYLLLISPLRFKYFSFLSNNANPHTYTVSFTPRTQGAHLLATDLMLDNYTNSTSFVMCTIVWLTSQVMLVLFPIGLCESSVSFQDLARADLEPGW